VQRFPKHPLLFDTFPLVRSHNVEEARDRIGKVFSPHRLEVRGKGEQLDVIHNRVRLRDISLNVLHYGAAVTIDASERGDFYLVQLPLSGNAQLTCGGEQANVDANVLSVLQPQTRTRMAWDSACTMILVQVPRCVMQERSTAWGERKTPKLGLAYPRQSPNVAAWWQSTLDLTRNIDCFGQQWLRHPAACGAMEEFLLSALTSLLCEHDPERRFLDRGSERSLRRAKEYIHANLDRALSSAEIARHACVSPRTLEAVFKRFGEVAPLAYARRRRLQAVHDILRLAHHESRGINITEVALSYGFIHMGRFAAQYRQQFGCSPSETVAPTASAR
jgi:AraC-like DNA-binding protein